MVTITKIADDNAYQTCILPGDLSGTVYVRIVDTDHAAGNKSLDTVSIDHIYIKCEGHARSPRVLLLDRIWSSGRMFATYSL